MIKVEILADSVGEYNLKHRLITFKLTYPRIIHSEILTHRMLSRNSESSRAVPVAKKLNTPIYCPDVFGKKAKGMQSVGTLSPFRNWLARRIWLNLAGLNRLAAVGLARLGVAKQWANRPLEWHSLIEVIATADYDSWQHFLSLRNHKDAQPEMQKLAKLIQVALFDNVPDIKKLGDWHIPLDPGKNRLFYLNNSARFLTQQERIDTAIGRIAGVSYLADTELSKALDLGMKLKTHIPPHLSPYESVAMCCLPDSKYSNFKGWKSFRYMLEKGEAC